MSLSTLDLIAFSRQSLLDVMDGLTLEQINRVPQGFKNNLAWQLGHVIVTDQIYGYRKAGHPIHINESLIETYGNGTVPKRAIDQAELDKLKKLATTTIDQLKIDRDRGLFETYTPFTMTARQYPVSSVDDALKFLLFHEGLHLGAARALKAAV